jgi:hypothetical protein
MPQCFAEDLSESSPGRSNALRRCRRTTPIPYREDRKRTPRASRQMSQRPIHNVLTTGVKSIDLFEEAIVVGDADVAEDEEAFGVGLAAGERDGDV